MSRFLLESASAASGGVVGTVLGLQGMSPEKKNETFLILGGLCALIALAAGAQLVRIQVRVPEYGWTTQKVFHLLNLLCFGIYATTLAMWKRVEHWDEEGSHGERFAASVMQDLPGLIFFTTYTLLVLFWAEIYHQARSHPLTWLRPAFIGINAAVYAVQGALWVLAGVFDHSDHQRASTRLASTIFQAIVQAGAAASFVVYGTLLFSMLYRFPIESKGRQKKLQEVGTVSVVCALTFAIKSAICALKYSVYKLNPFREPYATVAFIVIGSMIPAIFVLVMLRKLPPKKATSGYQPIS